jgi:hypothetical protein
MPLARSCSHDEANRQSHIFGTHYTLKGPALSRWARSFLPTIPSLRNLQCYLDRSLQDRATPTANNTVTKPIKTTKSTQRLALPIAPNKRSIWQISSTTDHLSTIYIQLWQFDTRTYLCIKYLEFLWHLTDFLEKKKRELFAGEEGGVLRFPHRPNF